MVTPPRNKGLQKNDNHIIIVGALAYLESWMFGEINIIIIEDNKWCLPPALKGLELGQYYLRSLLILKG
jgi:hypothetical protein